MKGYEGIENKLYELEVERIMKYQGKAAQKNIDAENKKKEVMEQRQKDKTQKQEGLKENFSQKQAEVDSEMIDQTVKEETSIPADSQMTNEEVLAVAQKEDEKEK